MRSQSALPLKKSCAVRPCTVSAAAPADSIVVAISMAVILSRVQPKRIFAVTGVGRQAVDDSLHDPPDALRIAQQIRTAVGPLGNILHRAAEIDIDHAHPVLGGQPAPNGGQRLGIVIPHLHRQWPRLIGDAPEPVGRFRLFFLTHPNKTTGRNHLRGLQPDAAEFAHHLPIGIIREPRHRRLQQRRIDHQRSDAQRPNRRQCRVTGVNRRTRRCHWWKSHVDDYDPPMISYNPATI